MSCCGKNNTFAPINDTWSQASSMSMSRWQPYPELERKENYTYKDQQNVFNMGPNLPNRGVMFPSSQGVQMIQGVPPGSPGFMNTYETFSSYSARHTMQDVNAIPGGYMLLQKTWGIQPKFNL